MKPSQEHADSAFYGIAAKEIQAGNVDVGLMAKAVAKAKGNKKEAEVLYLEWRVDLLKEEAIEIAKFEKEQEAIAKAAQKKEKPESSIDIIEYIIFFVLGFGGLLALIVMLSD